MRKKKKMNKSYGSTAVEMIGPLLQSTLEKDQLKMNNERKPSEFNTKLN